MDSYTSETLEQCENQVTPFERFGLQIILCRRKAGYNPEEFAERIGLDIGILAALEHGAAPLEVVCKNLGPIADGLGIKQRALMYFLIRLCFDEI